MTTDYLFNDHVLQTKCQKYDYVLSLQELWS